MFECNTGVNLYTNFDVQNLRDIKFMYLNAYFLRE